MAVSGLAGAGPSRSRVVGLTYAMRWVYSVNLGFAVAGLAMAIPLIVGCSVRLSPPRKTRSLMRGNVSIQTRIPAGPP